MAIVQEVGQPGGWLDERDLPANVTFVRDATALPADPFEYVLWITDRLLTDVAGSRKRVLWFRPRSLVLGVGCERGISGRGAGRRT